MFFIDTEKSVFKINNNGFLFSSKRLDVFFVTTQTHGVDTLKRWEEHVSAEQLNKDDYWFGIKGVV